MKKRYLKTPEDVIALKDTDTKIYDSCYNETDTYNKFVNGVLCRFDKNGGIKFNDGIYLKAHDYYIYEEEQEQQEATEDDIGKLCKFWDSDEKGFISVLRSIEVASQTNHPFVDDFDDTWKHCRRLSPSEVAEITGYKVEEAE